MKRRFVGLKRRFVGLKRRFAKINRRFRISIWVYAPNLLSLWQFQHR